MKSLQTKLPEELAAVPRDGVWEVTILNWRPALLNELMKSVRGKIRLKKRDRRNLYDFLVLQGRIPIATGRRRVGLKIVMPKGPFPDPDNVWKSLLDGLKEVGLLVNDTGAMCEATRPVFERGPLATTITLEDMPDESP